MAEVCDFLKVGEVLGASCVGDGDDAGGAQVADEGFVYALLEAFVVGGVDQEFAAVGFEALEVACGASVRLKLERSSSH